MAISNDTRDRVKRIGEPTALFFGRLGLTPDGLTLIGFGITALGAVLLANQHWLAGGLVIFVGGVFDMFDGTLARATGRASKLGAFMDSVFDRAGEVVVYVGIVYGLAAVGIANGPVLAAAALGSAVMVSYTRSRSDGLGFTAGTGMAAVGIMPREVRLVILSLGLIAAGIQGMDACECGGPWPPDVDDVRTMGGWAIQAALAIITIGSIITVIQRVLHTRAQARSATMRSAGTTEAGTRPT